MTEGVDLDPTEMAFLLGVAWWASVFLWTSNVTFSVWNRQVELNNLLAIVFMGAFFYLVDTVLSSLNSGMAGFLVGGIGFFVLVSTFGD